MREEGDHRLAKGGQIRRGAGADQMSVDDDRDVFPDGSGIHQVVFDGDRPGRMAKAQDVG